MTSRVLPVPASPPTSTIRRAPPAARSHASTSASHAAARPTNGNSGSSPSTAGKVTRGAAGRSAGRASSTQSTTPARPVCSGPTGTHVNPARPRAGSATPARRRPRWPRCAPPLAASPAAPDPREPRPHHTRARSTPARPSPSPCLAHPRRRPVRQRGPARACAGPPSPHGSWRRCVGRSTAVSSRPPVRRLRRRGRLGPPPTGPHRRTCRPGVTGAARQGAPSSPRSATKASRATSTIDAARHRSPPAD